MTLHQFLDVVADTPAEAREPTGRLRTHLHHRRKPRELRCYTGGHRRHAGASFLG